MCIYLVCDCVSVISYGACFICYCLENVITMIFTNIDDTDHKREFTVTLSLDDDYKWTRKYHTHTHTHTSSIFCSKEAIIHRVLFLYTNIRFTTNSSKPFENNGQ